MDWSWCAYRPVLCHGAHTQALPASTEGTVQQLVHIVPDPASRPSACAVSMAVSCHLFTLVKGKMEPLEVREASLGFSLPRLWTEEKH